LQVEMIDAGSSAGSTAPQAQAGQDLWIRANVEYSEDN
jgi:hypothetical protein